MNGRAIVFLVVIALGGAFLSGCMGFWGNNRSIAANVDVTPEWTDIAIKPSVSAKYRQQYITLDVSRISGDARGHDAIYLEDGTVLRPELEVVDEQGTAQPLGLSGRVRKDTVKAVYRMSEEFAKGRNFTKIRIRSDLPFRCDEIAWTDYDPK